MVQLGKKGEDAFHASQKNTLASATNMSCTKTTLFTFLPAIQIFIL